MNTKYLISIVVPTFNRASVIMDCIASVVNQTYRNWELIIVDDCSSDNTETIINDLTLEDPRISFLKRPSNRLKGANACRNIGIEISKGEFIALLDSDDQWKTDHLSLNVEIMAKYPEVMGIYGTAEIQTKKRKYMRKSRQKSDNESYFDFLLSPEGFAPTPSLFMRKKSLREIHFDETIKRHQDWDFFIKFGERNGWLFSRRASIIVDRTIVNLNIEFNSCIAFYERYKHMITRKGNAFKYLLMMLLRAIELGASIEVKKYYQNELIELRSEVCLSLGILSRFPYALYYIVKLRRFLRNG